MFNLERKFAIRIHGCTRKRLLRYEWIPRRYLSIVHCIGIVLLLGAVRQTHAGSPSHVWGDDVLRVGTFEVDVSPPVGSVLAYDPVRGIEQPLLAKGIVLDGIGSSIVLVAIDWIGIGNEGHEYFVHAISERVGTNRDRVAVHTLHQHDAVWCDFTMDRLVKENGISYSPFDTPFALKCAEKIANAAALCKKDMQVVTHVGHGGGIVSHVASNRRILGDDGKVSHVRWSATKDPNVREYPEGLIDPVLRMVTFWNQDKAIVALSYYATHPQSYYRTGLANPDFPGLAREQFTRDYGVPLVHFNGAGGNITAGKYNDGAVENRLTLASRVFSGLKEAWINTSKSEVSPSRCRWKAIDVKLPIGNHLVKETLVAEVRNDSRSPMQRFTDAAKLAWIETAEKGPGVTLSSLRLGDVEILHMPGELFIEYQLAAQKWAPEQFLCMAAYGEYGPQYIGTEISYQQGGYETGPDASLVSADVEKVLFEKIRELLLDE